MRFILRMHYLYFIISFQQQKNQYNIAIDDMIIDAVIINYIN